MYDTEYDIRARRKWVDLYAATKNAALVCRRSRHLSANASQMVATIPRRRRERTVVA